MEPEYSSQISQKNNNDNNIPSSSRYMLDTRKHYLLASNTESLQALLQKQRVDLTNVLMELKSEYDLITRESSIKKRLIEEYNKKIIMLQNANTFYEKKQEEKKETSRNIKDGIEIKLRKKEEEMYNKKTLVKKIEKLSKDLQLIQKNIVQCENESALIDKKKERVKLEENSINAKKNQIQYKIDEENKKILRNRSENDLQVQYYETVIKQKTLFMELADERKERQQKIEQEAKNDSQDKQEMEKRIKLVLLMLYNKYLKKRMEKQLKKFEELEYIFQQIRETVGTQDLSLIINFVLQRSKRYNYNMQMVDEKQRKIDKLTKEINNMRTHLIKLKNNVLINEKEKEDNYIDTNNGLNKKEIDMIKMENEKNQQLRILGQQYNEVNLAYNEVITNIKSMEEYERNNPLDLDEEEKEEEKGEIKMDQNKKIKLTKEEENIIERYDFLLNKILKAFNILYLCKSKQEFINLMREKGINQQNSEENKMSSSDNTSRIIPKKKKNLRRGSIKSTYKKSAEESYIKKNNEDDDEEEDTSNNDQDKNILNKFLKEQKKEVDDFIKVRKIELRKPPVDK